MIKYIFNIVFLAISIFSPFLYCSDSKLVEAKIQINEYTEKKPRLILHFDINKTLIACDKAGKKTHSDVICSSIADQVFDTWDNSISQPINYTDYVKNYLIPNLDYSEEIKLKQKEQISKVLKVLKEKNHPDYLKMQKIYEKAMEFSANQKNQIFPSFYKLIKYLEDKKIPYTLVIRTFGSESSIIADELNSNLGKDFINEIHIIKQGKLQNKHCNLYELITEADHNLIIQDDWEWWFNHGERWEYAKPFPIDLNDHENISLFFDDNALPNTFVPEVNIIAPYHPKDGRSIPPNELIQKGRIFPVDMLEAICNEDYYIQLVEKSLKN